MVNLIRSAIARLTLSYLAIIMVLSITFSLVLYQTSAHELALELRRPTRLEINQTIDPFSFERFRDARISISRENLKQALIVFNLGTLVVGSLISYLLARHTLEPVEEAIEAQSRFTADASHELRTPLTAMQTEIEVALRNNKLSAAEAKELLKSNLEELGKLRSLSDGLLRLARSEHVQLKSLSVGPVTDTAIKQVQNLADAKKVKLQKELTSFKVMADEQSLKDTLVILLDNAIKYSSNNMTVVISGKKTDGHGEITVSDSGMGIKSKDLPHIFERFYRADQSRSNSQVDGHGLGLSIARQLIEAQKGQVTVVSKPSEGSSFTIKLNA